MTIATTASIRSFLLFGLMFLAWSAFSGTARAQSCSEDMAAFGKSRTTEIEALNAISAAHDKKLDPVAACPHLRKMKDIEAKMAEYMAKNKEWCNIPDDFIAKFKESSVRTAAVAQQACALAAKAKQMQENGGGMGNLAPPPKLPAGPL
ncbi:hypothetical protein [Rhodoblastus sp.]|uniref:hypothetical protein n=1 Tax=Rhodoblastus sp. TaxID=1962975 RepID=UPI002637E65C|nr:hypothetical protein [Rhodoblastus sp.]